MDSYHCQEYEELTMEEKILVGERMKEWFEKFANTCVPGYIFKLEEKWIIERLKEENDRRNRKQSVS